MPVATPDQYLEMLDRAKNGGFAYPAINVSSSQTLNAALAGLQEAGSDGIIQVTTGGADYFAGHTVKGRATGALAFAKFATEVAKNYPDIETQRILVDAVTTNMVLKPWSLDTVVATNLHADILSDLAAALTGSLGIAPTANLNPERRFPSMFEPIHGSAFDITGKGIANPVATFWTASIMLEHLGEKEASVRLMKAVEAVTARKLLTPDLGGEATTAIVTEAVCDAL